MSEPKKRSRFRSVKFWIWTIVLLFLAYLVAFPFIQPVFVTAWSVMPIFAMAILGLTMTLLLSRVKRGLGVGAGFLFALLTLGVGAANLTPWFVEYEMSNSLRPKVISELPKTIDNRLLPQATALQYAENANTDNRLRVGKPHLQGTPDGKHLVWQIPLQGEVWYWRYLGTTGGIARIDASETTQKVDKPKVEFRFGDESWMTTAMFRWTNPFSYRASTAYWQRDDGSWVMLISSVSYRPTWSGVMIPYVDGVMEIRTNGTFANYSITEAKKRYPGAALYPVDLAREYSQAYGKYKNGLLNFWIYEADLMVLSENPQLPAEESGHNHIPHYQMFEGLGLQAVAPFEPRGNTSSALTEILLFDAITGETTSVRTSTGEITLNGPRQAYKNVHKADQQADWGEYAIVEPKLIVKDDASYWLFTVVRKDDSNAFVYLVAVNAADLHAVLLHTSDEFEEFINKQ